MSKSISTFSPAAVLLDRKLTECTDKKLAQRVRVIFNRVMHDTDRLKSLMWEADGDLLQRTLLLYRKEAEERAEEIIQDAYLRSLLLNCTHTMTTGVDTTAEMTRAVSSEKE